MPLIRLFFSAAFFVAGGVAIASWLAPLVTGRFPLTGAGFLLAFHAIDWPLVSFAAAACGFLRVLSQFEFFKCLAGLLYWIDTILKALR